MERRKKKKRRRGEAAPFRDVEEIRIGTKSIWRSGERNKQEGWKGKGGDVVGLDSDDSASLASSFPLSFPLPLHSALRTQLFSLSHSPATLPTLLLSLPPLRLAPVPSLNSKAAQSHTTSSPRHLHPVSPRHHLHSLQHHQDQPLLLPLEAREGRGGSRTATSGAR